MHEDHTDSTEAIHYDEAAQRPPPLKPKACSERKKGERWVERQGLRTAPRRCFYGDGRLFSLSIDGKLLFIRRPWIIFFIYFFGV